MISYAFYDPHDLIRQAGGPGGSHDDQQIRLGSDVQRTVVAVKIFIIHFIKPQHMRAGKVSASAKASVWI